MSGFTARFQENCLRRSPNVLCVRGMLFRPVCERSCVIPQSPAQVDAVIPHLHRFESLQVYVQFSTLTLFPEEHNEFEILETRMDFNLYGLKVQDFFPGK
ncbi:hypothetical protein NPIL_354911 [Nephila pilipes]|uniref:Uncharacterized protein n=1 Tax=Nephila pilipes TaxID=299642 RepID=A0A8X6U4Z7_NEPPI|nr:hypothetical protein NPIL_354911 [Nephila pilipes]